MTQGKVVRFEEITRCPIEVQDSLLAVLSDRVLAIPELPDPHRTLRAAKGFSVIATANTRDRGVNEMSAALKRRFTSKLSVRFRITPGRSRWCSGRVISCSPPPGSRSDCPTISLTCWWPPSPSCAPVGWSAVTAEAVSVAVSTGLAAAWFGDGAPNGTHLVEAMIGTALKDNTEDLSRLRGYFARGVKGRAGRWREVYAAQDRILQ